MHSPFVDFSSHCNQLSTNHIVCLKTSQSKQDIAPLKKVICVPLLNKDSKIKMCFRVLEETCVQLTIIYLNIEEFQDIMFSIGEFCVVIINN